jgi:quercetin dioxygenase-like cupin family protein
MSRPHIEFIQTQKLKWQEFSINASGQKLQVKVLSVDSKNKASTNIIQYPENYQDGHAHSISADEELFILQGQLIINDIQYSKGDYAYLPAGFNRKFISSKDGADVLTFFEGAIERNKKAGKQVAMDNTKLVEHISSHTKEWGSATDPKLISSDVRRLGLRSDPISGESTWLLAISEEGMNESVNKLETHPVVEECFLLSGEFHMPMGVLTQGAYFWRPANIEHGPVGTKKGAVAIFRSKGGPLTTEWSKDKYEVQWNRPYNPILPESLKKYINKV